MKNENAVLSVIVIIGILVVGFLALSRVDQYMKNMAFSDCAKLATFTTDTVRSGQNGEQVTTRSVEPIRDLYKGCVEDKGYKTGLKI